MAGYQDVFSSASQLSIEDRLRLIDALASTVPDDQPPSLSADWLTEIQRRSSEIDAGAVQMDEWSVIRGRLFNKHGVRDGS